MLKWASVFGLIALIAGILGFSGLAAAAAQVLFMLALSAFLVALFVGLYCIETAE
jgi:uncharacterized membrane protein YtjA (UPF0391 family)